MVVPDALKTVREWAEYYIKRGLRVVPLEPGKKSPEHTNWLRLVHKATDFRPDDNIGLVLVNGLIDNDNDSKEAVALAPKFMPDTGAIFGRTGKPASHRLYRCKDFPEKPIVIKDHGAPPNESTISELRVNHQSMVPPSRHPSGEMVQWVTLETIVDVDAETLVHAFKLLGTAVLVARYYNPPGDRHDWGLALSGVLMRYGLTEEETTKVFEEAGRYVGDTDTKDRVNAVRSTYSHDEEDALKSVKALKESMGDRGAPFFKSLQKIWGAANAGGFIVDDKSHKIIASGNAGAINIKRAVEKLEVKLSFDIFSQKPIIKYSGFEGTMQDAMINRLWFTVGERFNFLPTLDFFTTVLQDTAWCNQVHPVRAYFDSLKWDGESRLDTWMIRYGGAADTDYVRAVTRLMMVAAVRRIVKPGCKFDELVVLESEQGQFKSTALKTLCPNEEWFSDDLPLNVDAKEIIERTRGKWIIEAAELSGFRESKMEHLKAMLSRQIDGPVRMAYARIAVEQPRQFLIIATTNSSQYLSDSTGNRRFWPIRVKKFDIPSLMNVRDQLWAEAVAREKAGEPIRLDPKLYAVAGLQQERRRYEDAWEPIIEKHFQPGVKHRLSPDRIWSVLGIPVERREERNTRRIAAVMQRLGFRRMSVKDEDGHVVKGWAREENEGVQQFSWDAPKKTEDE